MRREVGLLLLVTALFFAPPLLAHRLFLPADFLDYYYPWHASPAFADQPQVVQNLGSQDAIFVYYPEQRFLGEQFQQGRYPLWNPNEGGGIPLFASHDVSTTFPGVVLPLLLLPTPAAWTLSQILQVLATGLAMLGFLRALGVSPQGAAVGALAWTFGNWPMAWMQLPSMGWPGAALPACLWAFERRHGPLLALAFAALLVTAHLQLAVVSTGFLLLWMGARRPTLAMAAALALGGLLAAVELLPTAELVVHSERWAQEFSKERVLANATLTARSLLTAVFPFAWGSPSSGFNLGGPPSMVRTALEQCLYVGVLPLLLAVAGARKAPALAALAGIGLLFALGTFVYEAFYAVAPPLRTLTPTRVLFVVGFCLSTLAALGWDAAQERGWRPWAAALGVLALAAAAFVLSQADTQTPWFQQVLQQGFQGAPRPPYYEGPPAYGEFVAARVLEHFRWGSSAFALPFLLIALSLVVLALPWRKVQTAALVLVALDVLAYAALFHAPVPSDQVFPHTSGVAQLRALTSRTPPLRAAGLGPKAHPNLLAAVGVPDVAVYHSLQPGRYRRLIAALNGEPGTHQMADLFPATAYGAPQAELLGVGVHYTDPVSPLSHAQREHDLAWQPVQGLRAFVPATWQVAGREEVLQHLVSPDFDPREVAWVETDPGIPPTRVTGTVSCRAYEPHRVVLEARLDAPGLVVLTDAWYPGWRALVDGQERPILPADYAFRAVAVPAGTHTVVMEFRPTSFRVGLALSGVTLLVVLGWWFRLRSASAARVGS